MARTSYIPYDQDREDQKAEEKAERRAMKTDKTPVRLDEQDPRFGRLDPNDDEFTSPDDFAEYLYDEDRSTYTCHELQCVWSRANGLRIQQIRSTLSGYGLELEQRPKERNVRGFTANSHNRFAGNPMSGGGGGGSLIGMAE